MTWLNAKLKYVARFGYGDGLPANEAQDGAFRVYGSNGPYSYFSKVNTGAPAIIVGRKGSYGKVNWTPEPCFASDTTFSSMLQRATMSCAGFIGYCRHFVWTKEQMRLLCQV